MLDDVSTIDLYFGGGLPANQAFAAWQRIKKERAEALNPSHNKQSTPVCCCPHDGPRIIDRVRECPIHGE